VLNGIFLGFWKEKFFSATSHIFSQNFDQGMGYIKNSLTISAIEHIFKLVERGFHCEFSFDLILIRGWTIRNSLTISAIEHIFKLLERGFVNILCFISLLILCLEVGVIKRLLRPLNGPAAPF